jgi:hypothetical protein
VCYEACRHVTGACGHVRAQGEAHAAQGHGRLAEAAARAVEDGAEVHPGVQLSCGEHSDYGLLTLVNQDAAIPALQARSPPCPQERLCLDIMRVLAHARQPGHGHSGAAGARPLPGYAVPPVIVRLPASDLSSLAESHHSLDGWVDAVSAHVHDTHASLGAVPHHDSFVALQSAPCWWRSVLLV